MRDQGDDSYEELRKKILGLGDSSFRKTYYPALRHKQMELERFRIILDNVTDIVFLISYPEGIIVDFNIRAAEKLGFLPEDVVGHEITGFLFDDSDKSVSIDSMKNRAERMLIRGKIACKSGGIIPVEADISFSKYRDEVYCAVVCRDISERILMEGLISESEMQYRTTIEAITDGILVVNSSGISAIYNRAFKEQYVRLTGQSLSSKIDVREFFKKIGLLDEEDIEEFVNSDGYVERIGKIILDQKIAVFKIKKMPINHEFRKDQSVFILSDITQKTVIDEIRRDVFFQLNRNMEQFAILNDHIRNPLQALSGIIELKDPQLGDEIRPLIDEINMIVRKLDIGWLESEKVRSMIKRHYGVSVLDKDEMGNAAQYLKELGYEDKEIINN